MRRAHRHCAEQVPSPKRPQALPVLRPCPAALREARQCLVRALAPITHTQHLARCRDDKRPRTHRSIVTCPKLRRGEMQRCLL